MSSLFLTTNRSYLKFPLRVFYRHLCRNYDQVILPTTSQLNLRSNSWKNNCDYYQKRSITLHVPPVEDKQSAPNRNERMPFQFPPGNPKDKPKLEHLRFIENQLIHIVHN
jgi:hypothetical protein